MYKPYYSYNTKLKMLNNVNFIKVNKYFGTYNTVNVGIIYVVSSNLKHVTFLLYVS